MIDLGGVVIFHTGVVFGLKIKSLTFISLYTVKSCKVKPRQKEISLIGSRSAKKTRRHLTPLPCWGSPS